MPRRTPLIKRIMNKVVVDDNGCWLWTGYLDKDGYGRIASSSWEEGGRRWRGVHTWVWEHHHGPMPDGLQPDHKCKVKRCCNPEHIEPVTPRENVMRIQGMAYLNAQKTVCPQGHPYDETNTHITSEGKRVCRKCRYQNKKRYRAKVGRTRAG